MEIIGRVTADAQVKTVTNDRQVVNFAIAVNEYYTANGERRKETTFYNCAYWLTPKVAQYLTKGSLVSLFGSLSTSSYIDMQGEAQAVLNFHVNNIKLVSRQKKTAAQSAEMTEA
jgi:single-strand DNA-binding protein